MSADTLSTVLDAVRLNGAVFFSIEASAPWVAEAPPSAVIGPRVMPGAGHVLEYHVVARGRAWGGIVGGEPVLLEAGDVIVFPHGDPHTMSSAPGMRAEPGIKLHQRPTDLQLPFPLTFGSAGPRDVHVVCGFLGCDAHPFNPLLASLPRTLVVRASHEDGEDPIRQFIRLAVRESTTKRLGGECILARLSELMFVEVLRRHLAALPPGAGGWLGGLRDPVVGRALGLIHAEPARDWSLEELARTVGASRSTLAERFAQLVGQPPMQYLTCWRMQVAASLLARGDAGVATVAERVGYDSEAAFSRAFKKHAGASPGAWRRARGAARGAGSAVPDQNLTGRPGPPDRRR